MEWLAHGVSDSGLLQANDQGRSSAVPAVTAHRGRLWCLWPDVDGHVWYAVTDDEGGFGARQAFPQGGLPVVANLDGLLHAVVVQPSSGVMVHYYYDADGARAWDCVGPLDAQAGAVAHSTPALAAFHNKLFLVFLRDGQLFLAVWSVFTKRWTAPTPVVQAGGSGSRPAFRGTPALFVIDGVLHLLCGADPDGRQMLGFRFDYVAQTWSQCDDVSEGRAAAGVSAASYGDKAYLGFIEAGPGADGRAVYVATYADGAWSPHEPVAGATAADPPQIAILNGRIHCIFPDDSETRDLRWYSRPVLSYSLSTWMAGLADGLPLSAITVPGTHDSCARSNIPFVRTQYLSIAQQLALGIRFVDLRLRRHDDGQLYCYHGGIPIDFPSYLSFASVMAEVWAFLQPRPSVTPTETVLVSINNDDVSPEERANPAPFYAAVADAIAATAPYADGRHRWHTEPVTPTLGAVRGKAVLLRRYAGDAALPPPGRIGLDLSTWQDDNPDFRIETATGVRLRLQDKWKYADRVALHELVASKQAFVRHMIDQATAAGADDWFINFCSAVGEPVEHGEIAEAKWIAVGAHSDLIGKWVTGMNRLTRDHLQAAGTARSRLGIVNLDYPELPGDNDLVARLIETNF